MYIDSMTFPTLFSLTAMVKLIRSRISGTVTYGSV